VEVGGVEPPSYEVLAPASPSAANSEHFGNMGPPSAKFPSFLVGINLELSVPTPESSIPYCVTRDRRDGNPPGG